MSEEEAFLRAICENPDDDTARLVFADWLTEQGGAVNTAWANAIRAQIWLAHGAIDAATTQQSRLFESGYGQTKMDERLGIPQGIQVGAWIPHVRHWRFSRVSRRLAPTGVPHPTSKDPHLRGERIGRGRVRDVASPIRATRTGCFSSVEGADGLQYNSRPCGLRGVARLEDTGFTRREPSTRRARCRRRW
jgi:uncharacterized protein (TIGR02996 family)